MSHRKERKRYRLDVVTEVLLERLAVERGIPEQAVLKQLIHGAARRSAKPKEEVDCAA